MILLSKRVDKLFAHEAEFPESDVVTAGLPTMFVASQRYFGSWLELVIAKRCVLAEVSRSAGQFHPSVW